MGERIEMGSIVANTAGSNPVLGTENFYNKGENNHETKTVVQAIIKVIMYASVA